MLRELINIVPTGSFFLISFVVFASISMSIFFLTRKFLASFVRDTHGPFLRSTVEILVLSYGVLIGFVIITLWNAHEQSQNMVNAEANHLALMIFDSAALPVIQHDILSGVGQYTKHVTQDEWSTMKLGQTSPLAQESIKNLFNIIQSYVPQNEKEIAFYNEIVSQLNKVLESRRLRLNSLDSALTTPFLFILVCGIFLIVFALSLIRTENPFIQSMIITFVVTGILSFKLALAVLMDYPFSGDISISSGAFSKGVLAQFAVPPSHPSLP
ncbi:MAG: DUF4239 domain-containing protein [Proteobacteria bacterium]|nr:DUF4239 domain-containing protein [Pseudomonadota bacterium]